MPDRHQATINVRDAAYECVRIGIGYAIDTIEAHRAAGSTIEAALAELQRTATRFAEGAAKWVN